MTWEELVEKAISIGYETNGCEDCIFNSRLEFYGPNGSVKVAICDDDKQIVITIADCRTPDQMWQIMEALQ